MAANASELYTEMLVAVRANRYARQSGDTTSPTRELVLEAVPGQTFALHNPAYNVPDCKPIDLKWAIANVLHFFACTEDAAVLQLYNKRAERFVCDGRLKGAYGYIAVPQIRDCVQLLKESPHTRRAVVSMGGFEPSPDVNRPACWSFLHFLNGRNGLDLLVYQRSLKLAVMPYDCVLLCNTLLFAADCASLRVGSLRWTVGSLHESTSSSLELQTTTWPRNAGLALPPNVLGDAGMCLDALNRPQAYTDELGDFARILQQSGEVRT